MIASALPLVISIGALIVLAVTGNLFSPSPITIAAQVAAVALNIWARISFKKGTFRIRAEPEGASILKVGPYRFIRHPVVSENSADVSFMLLRVNSNKVSLQAVCGGCASPCGLALAAICSTISRSHFGQDFHLWFIVPAGGWLPCPRFQLRVWRAVEKRFSLRPAD
jgi:hypothetical protein